ncbi:hypothetical protein IMX26_15210 [Clostridium sp. 'deep sea']|uniref:lysine 5,6-aminomutase reactivase ATPase KamC n=1 Tax=Clostridium sp. 'deep sea' TaxID=2779445 RepID=UPI00189676DF|nr:hypothetical protein [Clostridium sp. 'deep sea']QOR34791.1 hypothetical protein IMX26_15210 [Clostridium sp. 'deep sea']
MENWTKNLVTQDFNYVYSLIKPLSPYGKELHRNFEVFKRGEEAKLIKFLNKVNLVSQFLKINTKNAIDIKRLLKQLNNIDNNLEQMEIGVVTDIALFNINRCCSTLNRITKIISNSYLAQLFKLNLESLNSIIEILKGGNKVDGTFYLADSFSPRLAEVRHNLRNCERSLIKETQSNNYFVQDLLARTVSSTFTISKHEADLIEKLKNINDVYIVSENEYTIKYSIRDNDTLLKLKAQKQAIEYTLQSELLFIKQKLRKQICPHIQGLKDLLKCIGQIDVFIARAVVANELKCTLPQLVNYNVIKITNGRHPVLEEKLAVKKAKFTPRSIELKAGVNLITGINMGGKTVTLRLVQLLTTMVHAGMPVPVDNMQLSLRDYVHFSKSDEDSILTGLSHFGQEINQINEILTHQNEYGLVLIDEIAHGTAPIAGESLAIAVLEKLHDSNNIVIVTTHYTAIGEKIPVYEWQTKGLNYEKWYKKGAYNTDVKALSNCIDYSLVRVDKKQQEFSKALKIAELLGMDKDILKRAEQLILDSRK